MSLILTVGATSLALSDDLLWVDEFNWDSVEQSVSRSITGALIVQQAQKIVGRPITLRPEDDDCAWVTRATLTQLQTWSNTLGLELMLTGLRSGSRNVIFRHNDGAIEASPVLHLSDVSADDYYRVTLRLSEV